jgi:hypothetical protein
MKYHFYNSTTHETNARIGVQTHEDALPHGSQMSEPSNSQSGGAGGGGASNLMHHIPRLIKTCL